MTNYTTGNLHGKSAEIKKTSSVRQVKFTAFQKRLKSTLKSKGRQVLYIIGL